MGATFNEELAVDLALRLDKFSKNLSKASTDFSKFSKGVQKSAGKSDKAIGKSEKKVKTLGARFKKLNKRIDTTKIAFAGLGAAAGAIAIGANLSAAGAELEAIEGKFKAVFKEQSEGAEAFAVTLGDSVGRSRKDLLGFLSTLQDTFVPLGFARDKAAGLAQTMTKLSVDVASFNDKADADVLRDFQSALVGNTETVRKYGVIINQAALNAELLRQGIDGGVKKATEQEKVLARLNLIVEGTRDAHDDAARTSGEFANQMKALNAGLTDAKAAAGKELNEAITKLLERFGGAKEAGRKLGVAIGEIGEKLVDLVGFAASAVEGIQALSEGWSASAKIQATASGVIEKNAETTIAKLINLDKKIVESANTTADAKIAAARRVAERKQEINQLAAIRAAQGGRALTPLQTRAAQGDFAAFEEIQRQKRVESSKFLQSQVIQRGFASGGFVPGSGVSDTVGARLTPGEFVLNRRAAQALGPDMLGRLNRTEQTVNVTNNMNVGGGGASTREQARAVMIEMTRATRRGVASGSRFG